jgi:hypothetical protein
MGAIARPHSRMECSAMLALAHLRSSHLRALALVVLSPAHVRLFAVGREPAMAQYGRGLSGGAAQPVERSSS